MGVICFQREQVKDAIKLLNMGLEEDPKNAALLADLATLHVNIYKKNKTEVDLNRALELLNSSVQKDSNNATTYLRFALAEYERGGYAKSWEYLHKCRNLDMDSLDLEFLKSLQAKMPDPEGVFR
jgi:tetratricopeptide (TPR) repeat protein